MKSRKLTYPYSVMPSAATRQIVHARARSGPIIVNMAKLSVVCGEIR